ALLGLDERIDDVRIRSRDRQADASEVAFGEAVVFGVALPVFAGVVGDVQAGARAAGVEVPRPAAILPHRREQFVWIFRIDDQIAGARSFIDIENFAPRLPSVVGL